jgi:hypothetical protein
VAGWAHRGALVGESARIALSKPPTAEASTQLGRDALADWSRAGLVRMAQQSMHELTCVRAIGSIMMPSR